MIVGVLDVFVSLDSCIVMMSALCSCASWVSSESLFLIQFMFTWSIMRVLFLFAVVVWVWLGLGFVLCCVMFCFCLFGGKVGFDCCVEVWVCFDHVQFLFCL